ncbi:MAG: histidine phosphotransferase family protein [Pseudomonadota bacterium]
MTYETQIASLLSARICHDLVSPVGAVVNGVGLMQEIAGPSLADELSMIGQSAGRASCMLQFYRIAFGTGDADASEIARGGIEAQAAELVQSSKVSFALTGADGPPMPRRDGKIFCLMILCARALVGLRGSVRANLSPPDPYRMSVSVQSDAALSNASFLEIIQAPVETSAVPPRAVEFLLLKAAVEQSGMQIDIAASDTDASIAVI